MPQMAPIIWLILYLMFLFIFVMFNFLNYYLCTLKTPLVIQKKIYKKMLNWKC